MITIKSERELDFMRQAGRIVGETLNLIESHVRAGVTTKHLDKIAYEYITSQKAVPSFLNYNGFPASICASVNEEVVHGIPDGRKLKDGDIISIDIGACFEGYHGDAARTFAVGEISPQAQRLIDVTKQSFFEGIKMAKAGARLGDISHGIQEYVEKHGYSVVRKLVGHGVGAHLHEPPDVPNFGTAGRGVRLQKGMTLAVEPMVNQGEYDVKTMKNGWTVVTCDGSLAAHYENSIIITDDMPEILTLI